MVASNSPILHEDCAPPRSISRSENEKKTDLVRRRLHGNVRRVSSTGRWLTEVRKMVSGSKIIQAGAQSNAGAQWRLKKIEQLSKSMVVPTCSDKLLDPYEQQK